MPLTKDTFVMNSTLSKKNSHAGETVRTDIECIAIDPSGSLGSLYDRYQDTLRGKPANEFTSQSILLQESAECLLIKGRTAQSQNLLEMIGIDCESRLSIYLKMIPALGIASLIDYLLPIDKNTRFLYFRQKTQKESFDENPTKPLKLSFFETSVTHVITEISWGIIVLVVLQLPPDQATKIHPILEGMRSSLMSKTCLTTLSSGDKDLCDQIISTTVYSNIYDLTKITKLEDVYEKILKLKKNQSEHRRSHYTLTHIPVLYPEWREHTFTCNAIDSSTAEYLEWYLVQQLSELKVLNTRLNQDLPKLLPVQAEEQLKSGHKLLLKIKELHEEQLQRIREYVVNIRKGIFVQDSTEEIGQLYSQTAAEDRIKELFTFLDKLKSKGELIKTLQKKRFKYVDVDELGVKEDYSEQQVKNIICGNYPDKTIFCFNDTLRQNDEENWNESYEKMIEERRNNSQLNFVYADFTYSTYELKKMINISPAESTTNNDRSYSQPSERNAKRKPSLPPPSSADEYINILLLGESGVGKSTFINAFANYIRFQSFKQAKEKDLIVIIPVTFLMTINDNFDECVIKFGEADPNEDHNDTGQSVTQQCKSYVFNIFDEKKLRIIDSPGFGDTRGCDQDNLNMEEIFSFLNNIPYLNGICLLFKPEVTQLNPFFRSCCTQLFDYFGKNIRDYFIFCFTNTRSTFFAPGNTRPLLQKFFESFPVKNIGLKKTNIFCFDSESFRYLVAKKYKINFSQSEKNEFEQSWSRSVTESTRFRDFLCKQDSYRRNDSWKSIKDAQFQINYMIRPMLEAMRNLLRNMCLYKFNSSIELHAIRLKQSQRICYTCQLTPEKHDRLLILPDKFHKSQTKCDSNEQTFTEYKLAYEHLNDHDNRPLADLKKQLKFFYRTCAEFSYFLMKTSEPPQDALFLTGLERMISEETSNCKVETSENLNGLLRKSLEELKNKYEEQLKVTQLDGENINLSNIYELMKLVKEIPMVKVQLEAIEEYHQHLLERNQHVVHNNE